MLHVLLTMDVALTMYSAITRYRLLTVRVHSAHAIGGAGEAAAASDALRHERVAHLVRVRIVLGLGLGLGL